METLTGEELAALVERVFAQSKADRAIAILVDLPDEERPDHAAWRERREMAARWATALQAQRDRLGLDTHLFLFRNAHANNGELPERAWRWDEGPLPGMASELPPGGDQAFVEVFQCHGILIAPTELSATAPLKMAAPIHGFRAATMPGFNQAMLPSLRIDYGEVHRRVAGMTALLDRAEGAEIRFVVNGTREHRLDLDLRFRAGHASSGLIREPGTAGNVPSGEAYIVPYEGERPGEPSQSSGEMPVQFGDEVVTYRIEGNRALAVIGEGAEAARERNLLSSEPAYGNLAELGLGILADMGVEPVGEILLDEKLGLHIAFGRSEHFGGMVGPDDFSGPDAVVHIDRIYLPSVQPRVSLARVDLVMPGGIRDGLIRDDKWVVSL
ncbi:MAG: hypothetical protein ISR64_03935 [Deltaproteobacteria bacterium]|nr:hypothetical protein [Deltaproteobacteria bacterium]